MCRKLIITFIIVFVLFPNSYSEKNDFVMNSNIAYKLFEGCSHVDIQYDIKRFDQLRNCKRIYGGLKILNLQAISESDFIDISYPDLTEITGYLYIHKVSGLKSLGNIFPNLSVIRGDILLHQAAVMITENPDLMNIGLQSLSYIGRGGVVIQNNPKLCYIKTINWNIIFKDHENKFLVVDENNNNECKLCDNEILNCWSSKVPQKHCNIETDFCNLNGIKCNDECLGACSNSDINDCAACKNFMHRDCSSGRCKTKCLAGRDDSSAILFNSRYLINDALCYEMNGIPLEENCVRECPHDNAYVRNGTNDFCIYSKSLTNHCSEMIISSTEELFKDNISLNCTDTPKVILSNINENVHKSADTIADRLTQIFGTIANIRYCLKVENSSAIQDLNFFRHLTKIREKCEELPEPYSIIIQNNSRLQSLFLQKVSSKKGAVVIRSNPSLCPDIVDSWRHNSKLPDSIAHYFQNSLCDVPIVNFQILTSTESALIQIDKLMDGIKYKLVYGKKGTAKDEIEMDVSNEVFEIINLAPNTSYEVYIASSRDYSKAHQFKTSKKSFTTRSFKKYIQFQNDNENSTTESSVIVKWVDLNIISKNEGIFYLIEVTDVKPAVKVGHVVKGKSNYACDILQSEQHQLTGYDIYYLQPKLNISIYNLSFVVETTEYMIKSLMPLHCYKIDISLCKKGNVPRCSQPESKVFQTKDKTRVVSLTIAQKVSIFLIPIAVITVYVIYRLIYKFNKLKKKQFLVPDPETPIDEIFKSEYANCEDFDLAGLLQLRGQMFEIKPEAIEKYERIGGGQFGEVYKGTWKNGQGEKIKVAIKTVKNAGDDNYKKFIEEALNLKFIQTHHIVKAYGCVLVRVPLIVMEFMEHKDLRTFLINHKPAVNVEYQEITVCEGYGRPEDLFENAIQNESLMRPIFDMAIEIADGMAYLEHKKLVHRDLACRNCMVAGDLTIKIGDFGMTRQLGELYYFRENFVDAVPVRWMSPESLNSVFSTKSDVWSFGVVLWEIINFGDIPYGKFENQTVVQLIKAGVNLIQLDKNSLKCHEKILNIMEMCFQEAPENRISFAKIVEEMLLEITDRNSFEKVSFYHNRCSES